MDFSGLSCRFSLAIKSWYGEVPWKPYTHLAEIYFSFCGGSLGWWLVPTILAGRSRIPSRRARQVAILWDLKHLSSRESPQAKNEGIRNFYNIPRRFWGVFQVGDIDTIKLLNPLLLLDTSWRKPSCPVSSWWLSKIVVPPTRLKLGTLYGTSSSLEGGIWMPIMYQQPRLIG